MRRIIDRIVPIFQKSAPITSDYRRPHVEAHERPHTVDLEVFMPGVRPQEIDLVVDRRQLVVTARKQHPVRRNWQAANFEAVNFGYQLRVKLGRAVDPRSVLGVLRDGILKIRLRKHSKQSPVHLSFA